jgi:hypothetical protein
MNRKTVGYFSLSAGLAAAAFSGLMNGCQSSSPAGDKGSQMSMDATMHSCSGKNSCKGQGGCKTGDNGCKGKNSCKGKGGCNTINPTTTP